MSETSIAAAIVAGATAIASALGMQKYDKKIIMDKVGEVKREVDRKVDKDMCDLKDTHTQTMLSQIKEDQKEMNDSLGNINDSLDEIRLHLAMKNGEERGRLASLTSDQKKD